MRTHAYKFAYGICIYAGAWTCICACICICTYILMHMRACAYARAYNILYAYI